MSSNKEEELSILPEQQTPQGGQDAHPPLVLQNENVNFTVHRAAHCCVEYDVEVFEPLVLVARKKAIHAVGKTISLPGFRKGKVPDELVMKNYPHEIDKEWEREVANRCFQECTVLSHILLVHPEAKVSYNISHCSMKGARLKLSFETEPTVPVVDPKQFMFRPVQRPVVDEKRVEETIRQAQMFFAVWQTVHDRSIQQGDFVTLDVDVIEENPSIPLFSDTRFEVTESSMAQWMRDLVLGKHTGDVVEGISLPDADAPAEDKEACTPKKVRVTVKSIETATLPALDSSFFRQVGSASIEEARAQITALLNHQADAHVKEVAREQVSAFLLQKYPFDLPKSLVVRELQFRMRQIFQDQQMQKHWEGYTEERRNFFLRSLQEQSECALRLFYLCRRILSDAGIRIEAADILATSTAPLETLLRQKVFPHLPSDPDSARAEAFSRLMLEKAEDFIIQNASQA